MNRGTILTPLTPTFSFGSWFVQKRHKVIHELVKPSVFPTHPSVQKFLNWFSQYTIHSADRRFLCSLGHFQLHWNLETFVSLIPDSRGSCPYFPSWLCGGRWVYRLQYLCLVNTLQAFHSRKGAWWVNHLVFWAQRNRRRCVGCAGWVQNSSLPNFNSWRPACEGGSRYHSSSYSTWHHHWWDWWNRAQSYYWTRCVPFPSKLSKFS